MYATCISGTNAMRYGTMYENAPNLMAVTANGHVVKAANCARKSSMGYDLTRLFIDNEGAPGVIIEITLKLYPQLGTVSTAVCTFPSMGDTVSAVTNTIQIGVPIARVKFVDILTIYAINQHDKFMLPELPTSFLEFRGSEYGM